VQGMRLLSAIASARMHSIAHLPVANHPADPAALRCGSVRLLGLPRLREGSYFELLLLFNNRILEAKGEIYHGLLLVEVRSAG
jgi:hypothetical protein